jgi:hypothetical protein
VTPVSALTIWSGNSTEAGLQRVRADRAAAEKQIADLQAKRATELNGECDLSVVSLIDASIEAAEHTIKTANERIAIVEKTLRRQAAARREAQRAAAIRTIEVKLQKRTAKAAELEAAVARVVELAKQIKDERPIKRLWPFPELLPHYFDWRFHDLGRQIMYELRRVGGDLMPAEVKQAIGWPDTGDGIARAPTPRLPSDLQSVLGRNADHIIDSLRKIQVNEPEADDDAEAA